MEPKKENHLKNLHGADGVEGLTGRWRGTWYDRGIGNPGTVIKQLVKGAGMALTPEAAKRKVLQLQRDIR